MIEGLDAIALSAAAGGRLFGCRQVAAPAVPVAVAVLPATQEPPLTAP